MPDKANYLHQSDVQLSECRQASLLRASHTCVRPSMLNVGKAWGLPTP